MIYRKLMHALLVLLTFSILSWKCKEEEPTPEPPQQINVEFYLSKPDKTALFAKQETGIALGGDSSLTTINVNPGTTYQEIDGFGYMLTGGSAYHINNMSASKREQLLNELFRFDQHNIGVSYLRVSLGASDLDASVFSYNDLPAGETDVNMEKFSLLPDKQNLIPVLKEILAIYPELKILASPWSAPTWMKTNGATKGGELKKEYYEAYAKYFVKYVQEMKKEGIVIDAITVQNEPLYPGNNPSMYMPATDQKEFIKTALGPAFEAANINTKIIIYDHNADKPEYPISILNDSDAKKYINGSAFHLYGGDIGNLSQVHNAHPDKSLYFTEQWIGAPGNFEEDLQWHTRNMIIGATRNWCRNVLEWNLSSNSALEPHTNGGCTQCLGAITIDGDVVTRNPAYYIIAHASKFVRPGSVRIETNLPLNLPNVAFVKTDGSVVIIVLNDADNEQTFNIKLSNEMIKVSLASKAVGTIVW